MDDEPPMEWGWHMILGLALATGGCFSSSAANVLVKWTESKNNQRPKHEQKPAWRRPTWYLIILLYVADAAGDVGALAWIPLSLVAPTAALTVPVSALLAYAALRERLTLLGYVGSCVVCLGAAGAIYFGSRKEADHTVDELLGLFQATPFVIFAICIACLMVALIFFTRVLDEQRVRMKAQQLMGRNNDDNQARNAATLPEELPARTTIAHNGNAAGNDAVHNNRQPPLAGAVAKGPGDPQENTQPPLRWQHTASDGAIHRNDSMNEDKAEGCRGQPHHLIVWLGERVPYSERFHVVSWSLLTALLGGWSNMLAKCAMEVIKITWIEKRQWDKVAAYFVVAALPLFALAHLRSVAATMGKFDTVVVVPVYQSFFIISLIVYGAAYFQEFAIADGGTIFMFSICVLLCCLGIVAVTSNRPPEYEAPLMHVEPDEQEPEHEQEQRVVDLEQVDASSLGACSQTDSAASLDAEQVHMTPAKSSPHMTNNMTNNMTQNSMTIYMTPNMTSMTCSSMTPKRYTMSPPLSPSMSLG
mmetsp:Transcript_131629/g.228020  ORF Transcript_131629/g.228020 Transcript_131629/m.228020 type:complete len:531 (-) Transcript_131629:288-1880(-)